VHLAILMVTMFAASFVAGVAGFGFGLVSMGILPLLISVKVANPLATFFAMAIVLFLAIPLRRHVDLKGLAPLLVGAAVGIPIGVWGLAVLDEGLMTRILGVTILLYVAYDFFGRNRPRRELPRWVGYPAGLLSGMFGGAFSASGPPAVMYVSSMYDDKFGFKANITTYFVLLTLYKIPFLVAGGLVTAEVGRYLLLLLGPAVVGTIAGRLLFGKVSNLTFHRAVLTILTVTGTVMVIRG
jgi:uncharacterized protein